MYRVQSLAPRIKHRSAEPRVVLTVPARHFIHLTLPAICCGYAGVNARAGKRLMTCEYRIPTPPAVH
jgi:hypothetical protein